MEDIPNGLTGHVAHPPAVKDTENERDTVPILHRLMAVWTVNDLVRKKSRSTASLRIVQVITTKKNTSVKLLAVRM